MSIKKELTTLDWAYINNFISLCDTFGLMMGSEDSAVINSVSEDIMYELNDFKESIYDYTTGKWDGELRGEKEEFAKFAKSQIVHLTRRMTNHPTDK